MTENLGIVLVGHPDAGKSALIGRLLFECGGLNQRDMQKLKKEAQELGKYGCDTSSTRRKRRSTSIALHKHAISADIYDRYATIVYCFDFENINEENEGSNELKFEITIDPKAFISKLSANIDGELFSGRTKEKGAASKEYSQAKTKHENAILISQPHKNIPNVFEIKTNIDAKSKIFLTIEIQQYLQKTFGFNQLNVQILRNFDLYYIIPYFAHISFMINIEDKSGIYDIRIPVADNNDVIIDKQITNETSTKCEITGKITEESDINELILKYKIKGETAESHVLFDNESGTFCHIISDLISDSMMDEEDIDEGQNDDIHINILIPRRVMFVIDRSGSMSGSKWDKTIYSTIMALKQLRKGYDRFGIILFNSDMQILPYKDARGCILAEDKSITDAIDLLLIETARGSTNINDSLLKAMEKIKIDILLLNNDSNYEYNFFMNQIIFITDGEPNAGERNTNKIILNVKSANDLSKIDTYNHKVSIFSFGVGKNGNDSRWINDLNHSFLKLLSVNNNGFYQRIKQTSADSALSEYFTILSKPVLSNIKIEYQNTNITDLTQTQFHTLYAGNDIIICGKFSNKFVRSLSLTISAITGKEINKNNQLVTKPIHLSKALTINMDQDANNNNTDRIWAYLKLQQCATQQLIYNDMIQIDDEEEKEAQTQPLSLALKYQFVTPWSSMIVVKKKDNVITAPKSPKLQKAQAAQLPNDNMLFAYFMDNSKDERARGVTIQCSTREFFTDTYHCTVVDGPQHRDFITNMISGASQADVVFIVVSAKAYEFNYQSTNKHVRLCKLLGIKQVIVVINKMDSAQYQENRYNEIKLQLNKMLTKIGYKVKRIPFIPISGFKGDNIKYVSQNMKWYKGFRVKIKQQNIAGYTLLDALEKVIKPPQREIQKPFRMPISGVYKIKGVGDVITGRIVQGEIIPGVKAKFHPSGCVGNIFSIESDHRMVAKASCGDNVGVNIKGLNKHNMPHVGDIMMIDDIKQDPNPLTQALSFNALVYVQEHLLKINKGFVTNVHIKTAKVACKMTGIKWKKGKSTNYTKVENPQYIEAGDEAEVMFRPSLPLIVTTFDECEAFGRITAMHSATLILIGKVIHVNH